MQASILILILVSVGMSAVAQILLKTGMSSPAISASISDGRWNVVAFNVATNTWVILGLTLYALSAVFWLAVLARVQVSFAFPFVGLGFILTMLLGWWLMGDTMSAQRVFGTLLVAGGVLLIARGG
jgi:multidrug transporter EmrE-like cation transporter